MPIKLAIIIPQNKRTKIRLPERIEQLCKLNDIDITVLNVDDEKFLQTGPFHVLLHKIMDFHSEFSYEEANKRIQRVKQFASNNPKMVIVDDFSVSEKMTNRTFMTDMLKQCEMVVSGVSIFVPKVVDVYADSTSEMILRVIDEKDIKFPVLLKPTSASTDQGSHDMVLVFSEKYIDDVPKPCILQEFCNHSGIIYKIFAVGDQISICERPSIKDIKSSNNETLRFDTRNVSKTGKAYIPDLHECDPNSRTWLSCEENPNMLDRDIVKKLVGKVRELSGLYLFGLDVLLENATGNYALIDCNPFPGYTGIREDKFPTQLVELIKKLAA